MRFRATQLLLDEFDEVIFITCQGDAWIVRDRGYAAPALIEKLKAGQLLPDEILKQIEENKKKAKIEGLGKPAET